MKNQYRFFLEDNNFSKEIKHQIFNVLRLKIGDKITVVKGGIEYLCELEENSYNILEEITINRECPINLVLAIGAIKKDKIEYVLQKCVEVGVNGFILFNGENSVKSIDVSSFEKMLPRYKKIIREACEQSLRLKEPNIELCELDKIDYNSFDKVFITDVDGLNFQSYVKENTRNILLLIGPEGGFSDKEMNFLKSKGDLIKFGPRIMRSETSAIVISGSIINYFENQ